MFIEEEQRWDLDGVYFTQKIVDAWKAMTPEIAKLVKNKLDFGIEHVLQKGNLYWLAIDYKLNGKKQTKKIRLQKEDFMFRKKIPFKDVLD